MAESVISVKDVKIKYRCFKKVSLLKSIFAPKKFSKTEYFEAVKGVSFEVEKGQILGIVGKKFCLYASKKTIKQRHKKCLCFLF